MLCPIHVGPSFHQGLHTKNGLDLLLTHRHGPVGLVRPYLIFLSSSHADYIYFMMTCHTERIKSMFVCNSVEFLFYHFHTRAILFFLMFLLYPFYLFIYLFSADMY